MIAVDTNVLVRLIVADDAGQGKRAAELFARSAQVWVAKMVVLETAWVLHSAYGFSRHDVAGALRRLAGLPNVITEDAEQVAFALDLSSRDMDFADALHVAACREAGTFYTFDRRLIRHADAVGIIVSEPEDIGS
ncbi:MAG: type II toxin-antitoxin system VapC family toxin [Rhodospirillales bacterium]|nr:type II toxin-antitoxin system VapC family toxin [Rhodospirillales bacterium]